VAPSGIAHLHSDRVFDPAQRLFRWADGRQIPSAAHLRWFEGLVDTGPQDWKKYVLALVVFNIALFVFGFIVPCLHPVAPLNPRGLGLLEPTTVFNTSTSST